MSKGMSEWDLGKTGDWQLAENLQREREAGVGDEGWEREGEVGWVPRSGAGMGGGSLGLWGRRDCSGEDEENGGHGNSECPSWMTAPFTAGMRILVTLLLDTLPMLGNVLLLCFFVFFIFGIVGVQLWAGLLRNRCFLPENFSM